MRVVRRALNEACSGVNPLGRFQDPADRWERRRQSQSTGSLILAHVDDLQARRRNERRRCSCSTNPTDRYDLFAPVSEQRRCADRGGHSTQIGECSVRVFCARWRARDRQIWVGGDPMGGGNAFCWTVARGGAQRVARSQASSSRARASRSALRRRYPSRSGSTDRLRLSSQKLSERTSHAT
jgi:hypothetical protein